MEREINLNEVLFHGLGHNELEDRAEDSIRRLENIFKTKSILSRNKQREILPKYNVDVPLYYLPLKNGDDYICVCKRKSDNKNAKISEAFYQFVDGGISLILLSPLRTGNAKRSPVINCELIFPAISYSPACNSPVK